MKYFLLLLLISLAGWQTGYSQTAQKQATQVITLRLMPVHVIEVPAAANLKKNTRDADQAALPQVPGKWLIDKQLLAANNKQATSCPTINESNPLMSPALNRINMTSAVVYTVTSL